jgi:cell division protein FtsQ
VTVREHRRRRKAALRRGRRASTVLLIIACVLIVLVAAAFFVYQSPLFTVKEVRVEGAQRLGGARLTELAAVAEGSTLLRLDSEGIRERLESDPWVLAAEVHRSFPATVVLVVQERQMAAVVKAPASQDGASPSEAILSEDGVWLAVFATPATTTTTGEGAAGEGEGAEGEGEGEGAAGEGTEGEGEGAGEGSTDADTAGEGAANSETATLPAQGAASLLEDVRLGAAEVEALPLVEDVAQGLSFEVGRAVVDEGVLNALAIINGFSPDMLAQLRSISAPDRVKTMLTLTNNVGVAFGAAEDIEAKEQVIRALLAEHEGRLTYINVRVADRASYRGTD